MNLWPDGRPNNPLMEMRQARGSDYSWGTLTRARPGDRIWIQVGPYEGPVWTCGPFVVPRGKGAVETHKGAVSSRYNHTRVCAARGSYQRCTDWYYDPNGD